MAEIVPPPPQPPGAPLLTTEAPPSPRIFRAAAAVLTKPAAFFDSMRAQTGFGPPIVFAMAMGLVSGVISAVLLGLGLGAARGVGAGGVGVALAGIVLAPLIAVAVGSFLGGAIVHLIAVIARGKGTFEHSVRIASYSLAVLPLAALLDISPFLPTLANLYGIWIVVAGVLALHAADRRRTYAAAAVLAAVVAVVGVAGTLAGAGGEDPFGHGSSFQREVEKAREEMKRRTEDLQRAAERAKQGQ